MSLKLSTLNRILRFFGLVLWITKRPRGMTEISIATKESFHPGNNDVCL